MTLHRLRLAAHAGALASILIALLHIVTPNLGGRLFGDLLAFAALLALLGGLIALDALATRLGRRPSEDMLATVRSFTMGTAFLALLYHLAGLTRQAMPIRAAIDALVPAGLLQAAGLFPGLLLLAATEMIRGRGTGRKTA